MATQDTGSMSGGGATGTARQEKSGERAGSITPAGNDQRWSTPVAKRTTSPAWYSFAGSPFTLMRRVAEDMDRIFQDFGMEQAGSSSLGSDRLIGEGNSGAPEWASTATWSPAIEVSHRDGSLVVRAELPGLDKKDVNVEIDDDMLVISGERSAERHDEKGGYFRSERSYGRFFRAIPLPEGADTHHCDASFKNGVLEVTVKAPESAGKVRRAVEVK